MLTPETAYRDFRDKLCGYIARRLGNPDDVEDVLQEVFVRVARNTDALRDARKPLAWLYTATNSAIVDHARKMQRNPLRQAEDLEVTAQPQSQELPGSDFESCLLPLLNNLPEKYRDAVRLIDLEDGKQTDLTAQINRSVPAAKSRVQRGRRLLREAILDCCHVKRDSLKNVAALECGKSGKDPCC